MLTKKAQCFSNGIERITINNVYTIVAVSEVEHTGDSPFMEAPACDPDKHEYLGECDGSFNYVNDCQEGDVVIKCAGRYRHSDI